MEIIQTYSSEIGLAAVVLSVAAIFLSLVVLARVQQFAKPFDELAKAAAADEDVATTLKAQIQGVAENRKRIDETLTYTRHLRAQAMNAMQAIGFLRYDAFDDIRGKQSFSLCMLDAHQNGLIISSIAGRMDSRTYSKPVTKGAVDMVISEEEDEALELAKEHLAEVDEPVVAGV